MSLRVNNQLWIISDTHFGHKNIARFAGRHEGHECDMISEWIRLVKPQDQILHMGDVFFGNRSRWKEILNWLPGEKFLIKGNHDKEKDSFYESCSFTIIPEFIHDDYTFTHRPATEFYPGPRGFWHTNIHGHIHNNPYHADHDGVLYSDKQYINVCVEMTDLKPIQLGGIWKHV